MSDWIESARSGWRWRGQERPPFAEEPAPGQESVWDYPRPPRVEPVGDVARVELAGQTLAESNRAVRVLETAGAPTIYLPMADVRMRFLERTAEGGICEWKGPWVFWTARVGDRSAPRAAWSCVDPWSGFEALREHLAFYPARVDACWLGDRRAAPQPGGFYGGWVTPELAGPIKGAPGSEGW